MKLEGQIGRNAGQGLGTLRCFVKIRITRKQKKMDWGSALVKGFLYK